MTWIAVALLEAATMGLVNVIDSHLISRRMPTLWAYLIPVGALHFAFAVVLIEVNPLPNELDGFTWFAVIGSGVTRTAAVLLMLYTMRTEEVSRIVPVVYTYPIWVALLAMPLLGEDLSYVQWLAVLMTVFGAVLISMRKHPATGSNYLGRSFVLLMLSSILLGIANIAAKYSLERVSFWNMYSVCAVCYGVAFCVIAIRFGGICDLLKMKGRRFALGLVGFNELLTLAGILFSFWAIEMGPVSLASTLMGTRPFFVFLCVLGLSVVFPPLLNERISGVTAALKAVSICLIVGGVAIINLAPSA